MKTSRWVRIVAIFLATLIMAVAATPVFADTQTTYTITASAGANGTISPSGAVVVDAGANQGFTIAANSSYHIADVLVDGVSQGTIGSYTFTSVVANHTISASFTQTSTATPTPGTHSLKIEGPEKVSLMQEVTFTVVEKPGHNPVAAADVWQIPRANVSQVKASFKQAQSTSGASTVNYESLIGSLGTKLGTTDATGKLSATFGTAGKYSLVAINSGYLPGFAQINVSNKPQKLTIKAPKNVTPAQQVTMTIAGKNTHQPVEGVSVWVFSRDQVNQVKQAVSSKTTDAGTALNSLTFCTLLGTTDAQGKLNATFQTGKYFLVAFKTGYAPVFTPLMVKDKGKANNSHDNKGGAKTDNGQEGKGNNKNKPGKEN
ncbi:MAG: hypothetical protein WC749_06900 [Dehalococcoidia bacterium]